MSPTVAFLFDTLLCSNVVALRSLRFSLFQAARLYFGSLADSMLSLFMSISGGVSWENVVTPLKAVSVAWVFLFLFYVSFTYFAVLNVVTAAPWMQSFAFTF